MGCSAQRVPSLSNVAMRSATGTKSGEPDLVVFVTNSTMDFFAGPSFQEGNGSGVVWAAKQSALRIKNAAAEKTQLTVLGIVNGFVFIADCSRLQCRTVSLPLIAWVV